MNALTPSTLSAETARVDRSGHHRPAEAGAPPGESGGFAGLLRAAGRQDDGAVTLPTGGMAGGPDAASFMPGSRPVTGNTQRADGDRQSRTAAAGQDRDGRPATAQAAERRTTQASAEERSRAHRSTSEAPQREEAVSSEGARVDDAAADEDEEPSADPAGTGPTLAQWLWQAASRSGGAPRAGAGVTAGDEDPGAAVGRGAGRSAAGGMARPGGQSVGGAPELPAWMAAGLGTQADLGTWAGAGHMAFDGQADVATALASAPPIAEPGVAGLQAPAGDAAAASLQTPGTDLAASFAQQFAARLDPGMQGSFGAGAVLRGEATVQTPVDAAGFGDEVMLRIAGFSREGVQEASLHLNPAELGPIQVRISVESGQARIDFGAAAERTRELLEAALPALAQALREDGVALAAGSVSASFAANDAGGDAASNAGGSAADALAHGDTGDDGSGRSQGHRDARDPQDGAGRSAGRTDADGARAQGLAGWTSAANLPAPGSVSGVSGLRGLDLYA